MAGGTWSSQNKKQPGVYINVASNRKPRSSTGERGIVAICEPLSWGEEETIMRVRKGDDFTSYIGYNALSTKARFLQEIFTGTDHTAAPLEVLLYRPKATGATQAKASLTRAEATARYKGIRGNDIKIAIQLDPDKEDSFLVQTFVESVLKHTQSIHKYEDFTGNEWVIIQGAGTPESTAGIKLEGGTDGSISALDYVNFLQTLESYTFNILIYDGSETTIQNAVISFTKRMRENLGRKCQSVMACVNADSEAVISVHNGYILNDGTEITPQQATWWVGGIQAGAAYNESLVYAKHPYAKSSFPRMSSMEINAALEKGQIVIMEEFGSVKVVSDINTLVSYSGDKSNDFSYNQVVRVLDTIANDIYMQFSENYIGRIQNNATGRNLLKSWIVGYIGELQANGGIRGFTVDDVSVEAGDSINSVIIQIAVVPVAAVEKIYVSLTLTDE